MRQITNLVTGGSGFLGSHLIDRLMQKKEKVICIDNYISGNKRNIRKWLFHENFREIKHDIIYPINLDVDKIWHLACPASPHKFSENPLETIKANFIGTMNMLELAKSLNARILIASSSAIYGDPEIHPQIESYRGSVNTFGERSCYEEGKRIAETLCFNYKNLYKCDVKIARIFNTYGPRMSTSDGRVISNFIVQAIRNEAITIYGDGTQTRSFCYVDDLINGLLALMESNFNCPINLGNNSEIKIIDLANLLKNKINKDLNFSYQLLPENDPLRRNPSILLAKRELNWEPSICLDIGLNKTIEYFQNQVKLEKI